MTDEPIDWIELERELVLESPELDVTELLEWMRTLDPLTPEQAAELAALARRMAEIFGPILEQIVDALRRVLDAFAPVLADLEDLLAATLDRASGGPGSARPWLEHRRTIPTRDLRATEAPRRPNPIAFRRKQP